MRRIKVESVGLRRRDQKFYRFLKKLFDKCKVKVKIRKLIIAKKLLVRFSALYFAGKKVSLKIKNRIAIYWFCIVKNVKEFG